MIEAKNNLKGKLNNKIIHEYPELEDLEINPLEEEQNFKSDMYGYDNIKVNPIPEQYTIPEGNLDIYENGQYNIKDKESVNVQINSYPPNWSILGFNNTPDGMINDFNYSKSIKDNWTNVSSLARKFMNNNDIKYMPLVDTSNATNMSYMFQYASNLSYIPILDTSNVRDMAYMFNGCAKLADDALNNILRMCINAINVRDKTLNAIKISQTLANRCQTLPNYQDFVNAGWSTGY